MIDALKILFWMMAIALVTIYVYKATHTICFGLTCF